MTEPKGGLRRTSAVVLAIVTVLGIVGGRSIRIIAEATDRVAPSVSWAAPLVLFFLAAVLGERAWSTYKSLHRDRRIMQSDHAVRLLALAKASALVGALVAGAYLGYALSFADSLEAALPRERVIRSVIAVVAAVLVVAAALLLERACEVPKDRDDSADGGSSSRDGAPA